MVKQVKDIEELLRWTYQDQRADIVWEQIRETFVAAVSMTAVVAQRLEIGTSVDCSGKAGMILLHPDAEKIHEAVCCLDALELGLIVTHAKTASRPDLMSEAETLELIEEDPHGATELIIFERETYKIWWAAMDKLANNINGLQNYVISGPAIGSMPWDKR